VSQPAYRATQWNRDDHPVARAARAACRACRAVSSSPPEVQHFCSLYAGAKFPAFQINVKSSNRGALRMTEAPDPSALESILPEVHDVFSERQAERDLAMIKKVKKIDADTRQIVTNREAEIKEVVRGEPGGQHGGRRFATALPAARVLAKPACLGARVHSASGAVGCSRVSASPVRVLNSTSSAGGER
jgi:hypothetical protein